MKTKKLIQSLTVATTLIFLISSCNKKPDADFSTDKTTYTAGETVILTNKSIDAKSYKWTMPDGQSSTSANLEYKLNNSLPDGTLTFKLQAFSKNDKKTSEVSRIVTIKAATGKVTFWQAPSCGCGTTDVTINGVTKQITLDFSSIPNCDENGTASFTLKSGTYYYTASDGTISWSGNVTVPTNSCLTVELN